ncbi:hypothetical protein [Kribbella sp. CA-293567]|uniref:hypothetical protein n=1 Tax=Kribbella sp. CA-293567 TaxID=3002436 RepID=UPI0022DE52B2|nr:hypothetical protein [Kribbella sp. CA-293567]WBQ05569.1 hypothetical protein OX958_01940 [Kribbella sp. CA-293567]
MTDEASGSERLTGQVRCFAGALAVGLLVAVAAGLIGTSVYEARCAPDDECWALLAGLFTALIAGSVAAAITAIVLAVRLQIGVAFGVGAGIAFLLTAGANLWWAQWGWAPLLYFGAALALVVGFTLSQAAGGWERPKPIAVLVLAAVLGVATVPLVKELNDVRQAQRGIASLVERPLQPELAGTDLWAVGYGTTGVTYAVLEPASSDGTRSADIDITLRKLPSSSAPCTGFTDLAPASTTKSCVEIQPGIWRGLDGVKAHAWVRGEGDQWAHVSANHYVGDGSRQNARVEEVARSLEPGSAWPLAAAAAECGFCTPLA